MPIPCPWQVFIRKDKSTKKIGNTKLMDTKIAYSLFLISRSRLQKFMNGPMELHFCRLAGFHPPGRFLPWIIVHNTPHKLLIYNQIHFSFVIIKKHANPLKSNCIVSKKLPGYAYVNVYGIGSNYCFARVNYDFFISTTLLW